MPFPHKSTGLVRRRRCQVKPVQKFECCLAAIGRDQVESGHEADIARRPSLTHHVTSLPSIDALRKDHSRFDRHSHAPIINKTEITWVEAVFIIVSSFRVARPLMNDLLFYRPSWKSGRWQARDEREECHADTTRLYRLCVLHDLLDFAVRGHRCIGGGRRAPAVTPGVTRKILSQTDGPRRRELARQSGALPAGTLRAWI